MTIEPLVPAALVQSSAWLEFWGKLLAGVLEFWPKFAWPATVLILALVFRRSIGEVLSNLAEFKLGAASIRTREAQIRGSGDLFESARDLGIGTHPDDALLEPVVAHFRGLIASSADPQKIESLLLLVARASLGRLFERVYHFIFGSQLRTLQWLNTRSPLQIELLRGDYEFAANANKEFYEHFRFESWLGFLQSWGLITIAGDQASITPAGQLFLRYLVQEGLAPDKPN